MRFKDVITHKDLTLIGLANLLSGLAEGGYAVQDEELLMSCGGYNGIPQEFCSVESVCGLTEVEELVESLNNEGILIGQEEEEMYTRLKRIFSN